MREAIQVRGGCVGFFWLDPSGYVSDKEGSDSPLDVVRGVTKQFPSERSLIIDSVRVNSNIKFHGLFSYQDFINLDIDIIYEIVEAAKEK